MTSREKYTSLLGNKNASKYTEKDYDIMVKKITDYFIEQEKNERPFTMTGLANALGVHKNTLTNYEKEGPFCELIKKSKQVIEQQLEERLVDRNSYCLGLIFNLKNNYGWKDQQEIKTTSEVSVSPLNDAMSALKESVKDDI